jgi:hypothetical protein
MLGTSSAALIGLLFVATSLHLAEIANEEIYRLRAQYTALILLSTLLQATAVLMPQPMRVLGAELLVISLWGFSFPLTLLSKAVKIPGARGRGGFSVHRAEFFIAGYLVGFVGAGPSPPAWNLECTPYPVLHEFAHRLDMEWLDDHARHRTRRETPKIKQLISPQKVHVRFIPESRHEPANH